ncbi:hypothetical protein MUU74_00360 [Chryseobacterium daecheongense]|uniref:transposase n=1 Tax=Chryseobacterium daecheongense TaxID=192389 RepID=UPI001FD668FC|nr:transposase [Chryseobacterium daecheongense]UOU98434.1 hypothetical protein MUU74_00360 [Chryseobacterium daecheongense]
MNFDFKDIHIGELIYKRVEECDIDLSRISNFFKCTDKEIQQMFRDRDMKAETIMKWSKLLGYDFFRIYSQHLILYAPQANTRLFVADEKKTQLPKFRKNIYTIGIINFLIELIETGEKTKLQVVNEYNIPKTTLYKWLDKYGKNTKLRNDV